LIELIHHVFGFQVVVNVTLQGAVSLGRVNFPVYLT
jgi:hypothetical protein